MALPEVPTGRAPRTPGVRSAQPPATATGRLRRVAERRWREDGPTLMAYGILVALVIVYAIVGSGVLTLSELNVQVNGALALILVTAGQTIVMVSGGLDLSVGGLVSLATCVAATTMHGPGSTLLWIVLILAIGGVAGLCNGALVAYARLPSFVVTLATWSIYGGVALLVLAQPGGAVPTSYVSALTGTAGGVGVPVIILAVGVCFWLWLRKTRTVSRLRAVGSDSEAARLAGVQVARFRLLAFVLSGVLAAAGGLFLTTQLGSGDPLVGNSYVLQSVAAAVIGGAVLSGGRGDVLGAVAGAAVLTLLGSVVFALSLPSYWQIIVSGLLLILVALLHAIVGRRNVEGE